MKHQIKAVILWIIIIIGMVLHFNYHIGDIFYGIDVVRPEADGIVPNSTHIIRGLFYHLPIIWILMIIYLQHKIVQIILLIISIIYTTAHGMHCFGELSNPKTDVSQLSLLTLVLIVSLLLNFEHFKLLKNES
jgi:hypothetical protein